MNVVIDAVCRSWRLTSVEEVHVTTPPGYRTDWSPRHVYRPSTSTTLAQSLRSIASARASVSAASARRRLLVRRCSWSISLVEECTVRMTAGLSSAVHWSASSPRLGSRSATSRRSVLARRACNSNKICCSYGLQFIHSFKRSPSLL